MTKLKTVLRRGKTFVSKKLYPFIQKAVTVLKFIDLVRPYIPKIIKGIGWLLILITAGDSGTQG